jgi:23S rRNA (uridine2552-2'-O)-methyltransferase
VVVDGNEGVCLHAVILLAFCLRCIFFLIGLGICFLAAYFSQWGGLFLRCRRMFLLLLLVNYVFMMRIMASKRTLSSSRWLARHHADPYVQEARKRGLRSRASIKLEQLQHKDQLFHPGMTVLDFGAAPGGWSQLITQWVQPNGIVVACDLLPMDPLAGVVFVQGDGLDHLVQARLKGALGGGLADGIVSDMAPNFSGHREADQLKMMGLLEALYDGLPCLLKPQGIILFKLFHGVGFDAFLKQVRQGFTRVVVRKPQASRKDSREVYLLAYGFRGTL